MANKLQLPDMSHYEECRKKMALHEKYHTARFAVMLIFSFSNALFVLFGDGSVKYIAGGGMNLIAALPFALLALFLGIVLTLLVMWAREKHILLVFAVLLTFLGMMLSLLNIWVGIVFLIAELTLYKEYKELDFLKAQEGCPHFNERFTEQETISTSGYQPDYDISLQSQMAQMQDVYDTIIMQKGDVS